LWLIYFVYFCCVGGDSDDDDNDDDKDNDNKNLEQRFRACCALFHMLPCTQLEKRRLIFRLLVVWVMKIFSFLFYEFFCACMQF